MDPPQHAAVFCVDEKTAIQALDRLDPVLPLSPGRAEKHGFEYYRHGTLSLYAALDVKTGQVHGKTARRHTSADFIGFLDDIVERNPAGKEIHIVLDNLSAHKTQAVAGVSRSESASAVSLHADLFLVAESGRDLVCENRAGRHRSRSLHLCRRSFPQADEVHPHLRQDRQTISLEVH